MKTLSGKMGLVVAMLLALGASSGAVEIGSIDFQVGEAGSSELSISADGPVSYTRSEDQAAQQLILDFDDAKLGKMATRRLDTSSFESPVSLVSPYELKDQGQKVRIVVQLRKAANPEISQEGNVVKVRFPAESAPADTASAPSSDTPQAPALEIPTDKAVGDAQSPGSTPSSTSEQPKDRITSFFESQKTKNFHGTPITLQVRDADVRDVLRLIGETSGFNIVVGPEVEGKLTLSLTSVPWDQALDVVLHTLKLGAERNNNVLRVLTLDGLTSEKRKELEARQAAHANAPRVTRVFPISYADIDELAKLLVAFGGSGQGTTTGSVQVDKRTNSIIVQDIPENLDRMTKLVEILDTQTPQVMVEAKIVEASETFNRSLGGSFGVSWLRTDAGDFLASFAGANPVDQLIGAPGIFANGGEVSQSTTDSGSFVLSPTLSFLPGVARLNAILRMGEVESKIKIVSSPKTVVLNKQEASIVQSTPVIVDAPTVTSNGATIPTKVIEQANIGLNVTPTVTNDESVLMKLRIARDLPQKTPNGTAVARRNLETQVLVESGSTLVIGGVYVLKNTEFSAGFPWLRKIPLIGTFFGQESNESERSELFIFITPRILNTKKAGLAT